MTSRCQARGVRRSAPLFDFPPLGSVAQKGAHTTTPSAVAMSLVFKEADVALTIAECAFGFVNRLKKVEIAIKIVKAILALAQLVRDCLPFILSAIERIQALSSVDPKYRSGREGAGAERYLPDAAQLPYLVRFENLPAAPLPAREVLITDDLDLSVSDLDTFQLGPVQVGDRTEFLRAVARGRRKQTISELAADDLTGAENALIDSLKAGKILILVWD